MKIILVCLLLPAIALAKEPWNSDGSFRVYYVADRGLSALRASPTPQSQCKRRLGIGRKVYVERCFNTAYGRYCKVAVTRRTRGYVLADALINTQRGQERRLLEMALRATGKERLTLLWLSKRLFPRTADVERLFAEEATRAASLLDKNIRKSVALQRGVDTRAYLLNSRLLDGYSRMGIFFYLDSEGRLSYRGRLHQSVNQHTDQDETTDNYGEEAAPEANAD